MLNKRRFMIAALVTVGTSTLPVCFAQQFTWRASVNYAGEQADAPSGSTYPIDVSADGRYVVFASTATNMVPGGSSVNGGIYRFDRQLGIAEQANIDALGNRLARGGPAAISADGRFVTFSGNTGGIWVRDMVAGTTEQASVSHDEQQPNSQVQIFSDISPDGQYVWFNSRANNLVPQPTTLGILQLYVRDRVAGTTILISQNAAGVSGNDTSFGLRMRGHHVLFLSYASNLVPEDTSPALSVYLKNLDTGVLEVIQNINSSEADISNDGRYLLYREGIAPNGIFLRDRVALTTTQIHLGYGGTPSNGVVQVPTLSGDGRYMTFYSNATNHLPPGSPIPPSNVNNVYVHDLATGNTVLASVAFDGNYPQALSAYPVLADNTEYVVFEGHTPDLVVGDTNGVTDTFLRRFDCNCLNPLVSSHPTPRAVCAGQPLSLSVAAGGSDLEYQWSRDGVDIPGATLSTYLVASAAIADAGEYTVVVSNDCGIVFGGPVEVLILTDLNSDGVIDLTDLSTLLSNFGTIGGATLSQGDLDGDGDVGLSDLSILLANFGSACQFP